MNAQFPSTEDNMVSIVARVRFFGERLADTLVLRNPLPWTAEEIISLSEAAYLAIDEHFNGIPTAMRDYLSENAHDAFCHRIVDIAEHGGTVVSGEKH